MTLPAPWYANDGVVLYCGDCREILPELPGEGLVLVSDPPYEIVNRFGTADYDGKRTMQFDYDVPGITDSVVLPALALAFPRCSAFHLFCGFERFGAISDLARSFGFTPKPWARIKKCPPPPMPGNWWPSGFELAMYGYKPGAWFGDNSAKRVNLYTCDGYRHGIRASEKESHPTQKWLPMVRYIVGAIVPPGGIALDPFAGSGTTLLAAKQLGRRALGIEIEEKYCQIIVERLRQRELPLATKPREPAPEQCRFPEAP